MANPSNLYAEKVFAEHPIALWSLDDDAGFASFISDANKDLTTWTKTGAGATVTSFNNANFPYPPLEDEKTTQIAISGSASTVTLTSTATFTSTQAETFSIGFYLYDNSQVITKVEVGYGTNLFEVNLPKEATYITDRQWLQVSHQIAATVSSTANIKIKITYDAPTGTQTLLINGFSIGNHSEEFNGSSTGQYPSSYPVAVSPIRTNHIDNPDFETNTTGWGVRNGSVAVSTGDKYVGTKSALFTVGSSGTTAGINVSPTTTYMMPVVPGQVITYSIYVKDVDTAESYRSFIDFYDATPTFITGSGVSGAITSVSTSTWTRVSVTATVPAGAAYARPYTYSSTIADSGKQVYFDAALIEESSSVKEYFDSETYKVISADSYGYVNYDGYYVVKNGKLLATNSGMPMVYGSSSTTSCFYAEAGDPALILPGAGFLHSNGNGNLLSLEAWLRIITTGTSERKILGPIGSSDGLYVKGPFLMLRIGTNYGLHYVGEWGRPMLVNINVFDNGANLLVNGETAISLSFIKDDIQFSEDDTEDFIAFYAHSDVSRIDIDCVAIYPYTVPQEVAKRRYIYGQGTEFPEELNKAYNGESFISEYSFSNYSNNSVYPNTFRWSEALVENLAVVNNTLSLPAYTKPTIFHESLTESEFLSALYTLNVADTGRVKNFFQFESGEEGYFLFESLEQINQKTSSIYGVFDRTESTTTEQVLIKVFDNNSEDYLKASLLNSNVVYSFYSGGVEVWSDTMAPTISVGENFVCGFSFKQMIENNSIDGLARFLSNSKNLKVYIAGGDTEVVDGKISPTHTFDGYVYSVGFSSPRNYNKISSYFDSGSGVIENVDTGATVTALLNHYASYTLIAKIIAEQLVVDIAIDGYWQDYIPLSTLSKYITNESEELEYEIDYVQFNLDYPKSTNTSSEMVRSYLSFQTISSGANAIPGTKVAIASDNVVLADASWATKMYEVVSGDVIYPPASVNTQTLALDIHLEFKIDGIFSNPLFIREMQISSKALNASENPIDSRFGTSAYPYAMDGANFDYRATNPIKVYKGKTPHLYLTNESGISLAGTATSGTRGIYFKINKTNDSFYKVSSMSMVVNYSGSEFPATATQLFTIEDSVVGEISFYVIATNTEGTRGKIYAEKDSLPYYSAIIFINGNRTAQSELNIGQWNSIGISFTSILDFSGVSNKKIKVLDKLLINSISFFQVSDEESSQSVSVSTWNEISAGVWDDWETTDWYDLLLTEGAPRLYGINPKDIFQIYTGTHKIIADSNNDSVIQFTADGYRAYLNYTPLTYTITPA